ncbi:MAG: tail fiber domain-containing protein [Bacteroidales bacterium]
MKSKILISALFLFITVALLGQSRGFNYQAIARDDSSNEIVNERIGVRVAILSSLEPDIVIWEEEHTVETNAYGLISLVVGDPTASPVGGEVKDFSDIDWLMQPLYIRTMIYYKSSWIDMGRNMLVSVPYSKVAERAMAVEGNPLMINGDTVYFMTNVAVGSTGPLGAMLSVTGGELTSEDALFEVRRSDGEVMFGVYNEGVQINVPYNQQLKGPKGGFAIGGFDPTKKGVTEEYFRVTRDSTRVYVNQNASKGPKGGFAIGGFDGTKAEPVDFLNLSYKNYLIGQEAGEAMVDGMHNAFFGYQAGYNLESGDNNVFLGHQAGYSNNSRDNVMIGNSSGYSNSGYNNIFIGYEAGMYSNSTTNTTFIGNYAGYNMIGDDNIAIGDNAGRDMNIEPATYECFGTVVLGIDAGRNFGGSDNTFLGYGAGSKWGGISGTGGQNTFVGAGAGGGSTHLGSGNVCLGYQAGYNESGHNKLYISNNSTEALIYGEFDNGYVRIDGNLEVTGSVTAVTYSKSDARYKTDLQTLDGALPALDDIRPVYYNWKTGQFPEEHFSHERQLGFIAQDVEAYFPELVKTDRDGYKSLDYSRMTVVLLQAVKEQQAIIEAGEQESRNLKKRIEDLEDRLLRMEGLLSALLSSQE